MFSGKSKEKMIDERKIIISLITNTEFTKQIRSCWNLNFIESATARKLAMWCIEFFDKYQKAPQKEIEDIYQQKLQTGKLSKEEGSDIEEILSGLSEQYEQEETSQNLIDLTLQHFQERHLLIYTENIKAFIKAGQIAEANKLVGQFKPLDTDTKKLNEFILTVNEIRQKQIPKLKTLMSPWLKESQLTILHGKSGAGKSLLVISVAYVLGLKEFDRDECDIGEWCVKYPTGCLYVDGELGQQEMEDRVRQFEWLGKQKYRMRIFSVPEYQLATENTFYLSERTNQLKIITWLREHPTYKLIILDSVSTLFGLEEENNNSEWNNKINPFLRDLRAYGVATILLHHTGKDNKRGLRGASSMSAMAHNIFYLKDHQDKNEGNAWFIVSKDKKRSGGKGFKTFALKYSQNENETETRWEDTENF
jgi:DNA replication protein DnaC